MLGVLLESRARRQRRAGGAVLSAAIHLAIVGLITMTTVRIAPARPNHEPATTVRFTVPKADPRPVAHVAVGDHIFPAPRIPRTDVNIDIPRLVPHGLPPIHFSADTTPDDAVIGRRGDSRGAPVPHGILDGDRPANTEWRGNELWMRVLTTGKPRYPDNLRQTGIEGTVVIRFVVDTTGRIDKQSVQIVSSTHPLFSRAVLDVLDGFRFKPAESDGHRVAALAEMPFEFRMTKGER